MKGANTLTADVWIAASFRTNLASVKDALFRSHEISTTEQLRRSQRVKAILAGKIKSP